MEDFDQTQKLRTLKPSAKLWMALGLFSLVLATICVLMVLDLRTMGNSDPVRLNLLTESDIKQK